MLQTSRIRDERGAAPPLRERCRLSDGARCVAPSTTLTAHPVARREVCVCVRARVCVRVVCVWVCVCVSVCVLHRKTHRVFATYNTYLALPSLKRSFQRSGEGRRCHALVLGTQHDVHPTVHIPLPR
jgi:hypothetical protein